MAKEITVLNKDGYKANCGFRYDIKRCSFKPECCNPIACDMFNINWDKKSIKKNISFEKDEIIKLDNFCKLETTTKKEKRNYEKKIKDKQIGIAILTEALFFLRFGKIVKFKTILRLGEKFLAKKK